MKHLILIILIFFYIDSNAQKVMSNINNPLYNINKIKDTAYRNVSVITGVFSSRNYKTSHKSSDGIYFGIISDINRNNNYKSVFKSRIYTR